MNNYDGASEDISEAIGDTKGIIYSDRAPEAVMFTTEEWAVICANQLKNKLK